MLIAADWVVKSQVFYFTAPNVHPLNFLSMGRFVSKDQFIHHSRRLDYFVLFVLCEGTLYMHQNHTEYELKPNQYVLLFPGQEHCGFRVSEGARSYYWCHFQVDDAYRLIDEATLYSDALHIPERTVVGQLDEYLLPETGTIMDVTRTSLFFRQLMDLAGQRSYSKKALDYTLSLLAMEITQDFINSLTTSGAEHMGYDRLADVEEYLRVNYRRPLTVEYIAKSFGYNANYISSVFKRRTGVSVLQYIQHLRLTEAKTMLLNSDASVKQIAHHVGYHDEKQFMKRFKTEEGMTPSEYRNIYDVIHKGDPGAIENAKPATAAGNICHLRNFN